MSEVVKNFIDTLVSDQLDNSFKLSIPMYNGLNISDDDMNEEDLFGSSYKLKYDLENSIIEYTKKKFGFYYMKNVKRLLVITDLYTKDHSNNANSFSRLYVSYKIYDIKNSVINESNQKEINEDFLSLYKDDLVLRYTESNKHILTIWTIDKNSYSFNINHNKWNIIDTMEIDNTLFLNFHEKEYKSITFYSNNAESITFIVYTNKSLDGDDLFEGYIKKKDGYVELNENNFTKDIVHEKALLKLSLYNIDLDNLYNSIKEFLINVRDKKINIVRDDIRNKKLNTSFKFVLDKYKTHIDILFYSINKNSRDTINSVKGKETKSIIIGMDNTIKRFTNDTNPMSYLSDIRKIKLKKPKGGRVSNEMRDYNDSMKYIISPNETPESGDIGLIVNRCFNTKIDYKNNIITSNNNKINEKFDTQINDINSCLIPFVKNVDANRVLFTVNHIKQTIATKENSTPLISTGMERLIYKYKDKLNSYQTMICNEKTIYEKYSRKTFSDSKWKIDDTFNKDGHLSLGVYGTIALTPMLGLTYEDSIIVSESFAKKLDQLYLNTITINLEDRNLKNFFEYKVGDIVSKNTPIMQYNEIKKVSSINFSDNVLVTSTFKVNGVISKIDYYDDKNKLYPSYGKNIVKVIYYISTERKTEVGDKLSCMVGLKGIISKILPDDQMPYCENGRKIDIVSNCISIINRMNIGIIHQNCMSDISYYINEYIKNSNNPYEDFIRIMKDIYNIVNKEALKIFIEKIESLDNIDKDKLIFILKEKGFTFELKQFEDIHIKSIMELMKYVNSNINNEMSEDGTYRIFLPFMNKLTKESVSVGKCLILPLKHKVKDKISSTSIKGMSSIKEKKQRLGEMELWALESYNSKDLMNEVLNIKSNHLDRDLLSSIRGDRLLDLEKYKEDSPSKIELSDVLKVMGLDILKD